MATATKERAGGSIGACAGRFFGLLLFVGFPGAGFTQYEFTVMTVDTEGDVGKNSAIAVNADNHHVHIAYYDDTHNVLKHAYLDESSTWATQVIDSEPTAGSAAIDIHVDDQGNAHIAYSSHASNSLKYAERTGPTTRSIRQIDSGIYPFGNALSIGTDRQRHPYIAYSQDNGALNLAYEDRNTAYPFAWTVFPFVRNNGQSVRSNIEQPLVVEHASGSASPVAHIVYYDTHARLMKRISYAAEDGQWTEGDVRSFDQDDRVHSLSSSLANGTLQVGYIVGKQFSVPTPHPPSNLYYMANAGGSWTAPETVAVNVLSFPESIYFSAQIEADSAGNPVALMRPGIDPSPWYAKKSGSAWEGGRIHDTYWDPYAEEDLSLAVDSCDNLHISFYDQSSGDLVYVRGSLPAVPDSCLPEDDTATSGGSSGFATRRCRAVYTSWTELPTLVCDGFLKALLEVKYGSHTGACPASRPCCFGCRFAGSGGADASASSSHDVLYRAVADAFAPLFGEQMPRRALQRLHATLEETSTGEFFTRDTKRDLLSDLSDSRAPTPELAESISRALNAIELDRSVPKLQLVRVTAGRYSAVDFQGVAWLAARHVAEDGDASLRVVNGAAARPAAGGYTPGWPAAAFEFEFSGKLEDDGYFDININLAGVNFGDLRGVRLFEVNKGAYRDITTGVDESRQVISGRTSRLSTYVVVTPRGN